jgi:dGTPase
MSKPLERLRFPESLARGRRYPEFPHPYRSDFQRDRDRIVHARAFRRLEDKTQVFAAAVSDHFRNRLTHTIEVSQIARTVAAALGLNTDLTEALALAHDIGHPPFAHTGEIELDRLMARYGESFEHNLHALRIVESFENPYPRFPGLNLTFEVREGIIKHSRDLAPGGPLDEYLPGQQAPLEAQLIDLCDEIAYNAADFDDAYTAGMLRLDDAQQAIAQFAEQWEAAESMFPGAPEHQRVAEVLRALINTMVGGLLEGTLEAAQPLETPADVRTAARIACFTPATAQLSREMKTFLRAQVYQSEPVRNATGGAVRRMEALFDLLLRQPERMPALYLEESASQPLHRQVCDYIAGMTDGYFLKTCDTLGIR